MNSFPPVFATLREKLTPSRANQRTRGKLVVGAVAVSFGLTASLALAPPTPPSAAAELRAYVDAHAQDLVVSSSVTAAHLEATGATGRDSYDATPGIQTLASSGTNYDWAKLVMVFAGFPVTDANVTVMTRWMRQENSAKDWWNRNNPLNNGWGASRGAGGTGSNVNLVKAAENAADALLTNRGYAGIRAAFADGSNAAATESAIWASPWATGHYANGGHWHYSPVDVVKAPVSAWGQ